MSNKVCPHCGLMFKGGDRVEALVVTRWMELKSSVAYALERPEICLDVRHEDCSNPKGEHSGD